MTTTTWCACSTAPSARLLALPEVQEKATLFGMEARGTTAEEMRSRLKADIEKWAGVIAKAGIEKQ